MDPKWSKHLLRRSRKHPKSTPKYFLRRYGWIHRVWFNDVGCLLSNSIIFGTTRAATIFFCRHEWTLVQPKHNKSGHEWTQQSVECLVDPKYYSIAYLMHFTTISPYLCRLSQQFVRSSISTTKKPGTLKKNTSVHLFRFRRLRLAAWSSCISSCISELSTSSAWRFGVSSWQREIVMGSDNLKQSFSSVKLLNILSGSIKSWSNNSCHSWLSEFWTVRSRTQTIKNCQIMNNVQL